MKHIFVTQRSCDHLKEGNGTITINIKVAWLTYTKTSSLMWKLKTEVTSDVQSVKLQQYKIKTNTKFVQNINTHVRDWMDKMRARKENV
jgi:hypothetical protein